jgi:peptidoglycan/LPS O-acetylase OafA/YrhL
MSATTTVPVQYSEGHTSHPVRRATLVAGVAGTVATSAFAAITHAAGVPFEIDGEPIAVLGFATMTVLGAMLGGILLALMNRYSAQPRRRFLQITAALTALSCIPSLALPPDTASKIALVASHLLATAVIVPILARNAHR